MAASARLGKIFKNHLLNEDWAEPSIWPNGFTGTQEPLIEGRKKHRSIKAQQPNRPRATNNRHSEFWKIIDLQA
jgi:hypothetical protein